MKKLLIAVSLALTSLTAAAQVTLSGKVSQFGDSTRVGNEARINSMVTEPTSNFAVSVKEKLGRDLYARGVIETSLRGNTFGGDDTRLGDRQQTVGLYSKLGSIDVGRNVHSHFLAITSNDVFSTLYGSVAGDVHDLRGLRFSDGVFVSLNPMKNVSVSAERTFTNLSNETAVYAISGKFRGVNGMVSRFEQGAETSTVLGLGANVGPVRVNYTHSDNNGVRNFKGDLLGLSTKVDNVTFKASAGKTDTDIRAYSVGADYHFSKRTEVGLAYRTVNRPGSTQDISQVGMGLTLRF